MKKIPLADVLWEAANVHLWDGSGDADPCKWSCNAALAAEVGEGPFHWEYMNGSTLDMRDDSDTIAFMRELGVDPNLGCLFDDQQDPQGVRYMWLLLAMHVAEDEGIMVEVQS